MKIACVGRGLGGEFVFDWRLEFRKAHPVVHQVSKKKPIICLPSKIDRIR